MVQIGKFVQKVTIREEKEMYGAEGVTFRKRFIVDSDSPWHALYNKKKNGFHWILIFIVDLG